MFIIYLFAYHFPLLQRLIINKGMDIKKTWEKLSSLIPLYQAFALPMHRDKQLSQPTPSGIIIMVCNNGESA